MSKTGILIKLMKKHRQERHIPAFLGEAGKDCDGSYYLKIDCEPWVQVYVYLNEADARRAVEQWGELLCKEDE